jgi:hypothetical protein
MPVLNLSYSIKTNKTPKIPQNVPKITLNNKGNEFAR